MKLKQDKTPKTRVALGVEYDGSRYCGWQAQKFGVPSVQGALEKALARVADEPIVLVCAGRTDSGVHGCAQVVHFDTHAERPERAWTLGVNSALPDDICVRWAKPVASDFHARFKATQRRYRYVIYSSVIKPALLSHQVTWTYKTLDVARMAQAARHLVGTHDFTSYRAVACQANTPIRTINHLSVKQVGALIVIDVQANAFLHHMIRNIAGVLMTIGAGEADVEWSHTVLQARDRRQGGVTASPCGLYFVDVTYPDEFGLPRPPLGPYFLSTLSGEL